MPPANFAYSVAANDRAGSSLALSLFADRQHVLAEMRSDAEAAGFQIVHAGALDALLSADGQGHAEVILIDCPAPDAASLAALSMIDLCAARHRAQVIVSTTVTGLDDVFGCLDQSGAQILVDPGRAERVVALGRTLGQLMPLRMRELSDEDRLMLLRLTEQVGQIAQRLERLEAPDPTVGLGGDVGQAPRAFRFESPRSKFGAAGPDDGSDRLVRASRPALPDPRLVRSIIRQRQLRARFFDSDLFADPAWDILLDLTAARAEHTRVSVTSLCIASGVPPTTALRWIGQMIETGLLQRVEDEADRRRAFIALSDRAADGMARYFNELGASAARLV